MTETSMQLEILAGTPPRGGQDRAARALAEALRTECSITNLPGRGGGNAWDELATRAGDEPVVSISSPTIITNKVLGIAAIDDRDLTVLAHLVTEYLAFVVAASSEVEEPRGLAESVADGGLTVAIATERGNVNHIALGRVAASAGGAPASVPVRVFDSARHAIADVVAGDSELAVVSAASTIPEVGSGAVRVVATSSQHRMSAPFDAVPTWRESGVDCVIGTWRGLVGPPGMSRAAIDHWDATIAEAVGTDSWSASVERHHWASDPLGHDAALAFLADQRKALTAGLRSLGLSADG